MSDSASTPAPRAAKPARGRALFGGAFLSILLVVGIVLGRGGHLEGPLQAGIDWVRQSGPLGVMGMAGVYAVWVVAMLPSFPLTMGAGAVWGPLRATLLVVPVATIGCTLAFLCGRYLFRDSVEARVRKNPRFAAIDKAVGARGFWLVLLLRLSPVVPYNVLNYSLGVTRVRLGPYVLGSALGMVPVTFMWAHLGATAGELSMRPDVPVGIETRVVQILALAATVAVTILVTTLARRALRSATAEAVAPGRNAPPG